jgi:hypothetical protein
VGTVLQAYLYRTEADTERLLGEGIRIRLCKGAYKEGPDVAFASKADVDANYVKLMKRMATSGVFCGIATHDEAIVEEMLRFVREQDAVWGETRFAAAAGGGRVRRTCLYSVRDGVVSVFYAAAGRTAGERGVPGAELLSAVN